MSLFFRNKKAANDFTEDKLPSNRKEVFFDCFKIRFGSFIKLGLLLLLFALPLIILGFVKDTMIFNMAQAYTQGDISEEEAIAYNNFTYIGYYAIEIICFMIFSLGLAGALRVIRQIVWGEGLFFGQDFFDGIKLNAKHYLVYFFLFGLFNFLGRVALISNIQQEILKALPIGMSLSVFLPPLLYSLIETQIYTLKVTQEYKNGFILYIKTFPKTILATFIMCLPLFLDLINMFVLKHLIYMLFILLIFPFMLMGEFLYFNSQLDKYINKEQFPEIYDKGIYRKENTEVNNVRSN